MFIISSDSARDRVPPHEPYLWTTVRELLGADYLESVPSIERHVEFLLSLEIGG